MAQITNILPVLAGQTLDADIHRLNFNNIISKYNEHDRNKTGVHGVVGSSEIGTVKYYTDFIDGINPIGSILEVWDNEIPEVKALIDTDYYIEFNGATINDAESIFNGLTIPDYTEAYLMIETSSEISNSTLYSSNTLDISHNHSYYHYHVFNHTHPAVTHTHDEGAGWLDMYLDTTNKRLYYKLVSSPSWTSDERSGNWTDYTTGSYTGKSRIPGVNFIVGSGSTGTYISNTTDSTTYQTPSYELIDTRDIKLYSIKCRRYLRIK